MCVERGQGEGDKGLEMTQEPEGRKWREEKEEQAGDGASKLHFQRLNFIHFILTFLYHSLVCNSFQSSMILFSFSTCSIRGVCLKSVCLCAGLITEHWLGRAWLYWPAPSTGLCWSRLSELEGREQHIKPHFYASVFICHIWAEHFSVVVVVKHFFQLIK